MEQWVEQYPHTYLTDSNNFDSQQQVPFNSNLYGVTGTTTTFSSAASSIAIHPPQPIRQVVPDNFGTQNIPSQYVPTDEIRHALTTLNIEGPQPSNPPITPECFRRNFKRWADLLEPIMSTAITLGYFNENLGWVTAPEPGSGSSQLAMLAYQAIIIVTQAHARDHPHVVLEPGGYFWLYCIVSWVTDAIIKHREEIKYEARKWMTAYGFSYDPEQSAANINQYESLLARASYLHWYNQDGSIRGAYIHPTILMILRQGFYARSESIVRRMHLVFLRYPSLNHIAPHLAWKTRVPLNAHVQVVISARHAVGEWRNGVHKRKEWKGSESRRFNSVKTSIISDSVTREHMENICISSANMFYNDLQLVDILPAEVVDSEPPGDSDSDDHHD